MSFPIDVQLVEGEMFALPTATPEYDVGTRGYCDERAFRYVKFGDVDGSAADWATGTGVFPETGFLMACTSKKITSVSVTTPCAGVKSVTCILSVNASLDEYKGGYCYCHGIGNQFGCRITGNTAEDAGTSVVFSLETPYPSTPTALSGTNFSVNKSPWMGVVAQSGGSNEVFSSVLGVQICYNHSDTGYSHTTEDYYGWIQTWGPVQMQANSFGGNATLERAVWADSYSFVAGVVDTVNPRQYIGFLMQETAEGTDADRPIVWLQICP